MGFPTGGTPTTAPLPTGAATETKQDAGNTLLDTISDTLIAEAEAAPRTAFGEQSHAPSDWPLVEESFQYGVNPKDVSTIIIGAGTVTASGATSNGSDLVLALPNTAHAATIAYATKAIVYRSGSPQVAMITPSFVSGGVANSRTFAGMWGEDAGWLVVKDGATFGFAAITGGAQGVYKLTVTAGSTSASNVTVTLDGTAVLVAVSNNAGDTSKTASEIAQGVFTASGGTGTWGFVAQAVGPVVWIVARRARTNAGAFSFSGGTTGATATMATERSGLDAVWDVGTVATPGAKWQIDGAALTSLAYDPTKGAIWRIEAGHLGHRGALIYYLDKATNTRKLIAQYDYLNTSNANVQQNPAMYIAAGIISNGSTTAQTMHVGSMQGAITRLPNNVEHRHRWSVSSAKTPTVSTATHFLTVWCPIALGVGGQKKRAARIEVHVARLSATTTGGASGSYLDVLVYLNARGSLLTQAVTSWYDETANGVIAWQDSTTTAAFAPSGKIIRQAQLNNGERITLDDLNLDLSPGQSVTISVTPSANNMRTRVTLSGHEIH